jgi:DivIVA domain-containing protein
MMWFFAVLIVLAIGGVVVVASGLGAPLARAYDDRPDAVVPADRPLTGADLRAVRFSTAVRGYHVSEVDALLERLAAQLDRSPSGGSDSGTLGR